eukprot:352743-Chlamydomonas_euryale.AAC.25
MRPPVRFLPQVVFSDIHGHVEQQLAELAGQLVGTFEALLAKLVDAPPEMAGSGAPGELPPSPLACGVRMMRSAAKAGGGDGSGRSLLEDFSPGNSVRAAAAAAAQAAAAAVRSGTSPISAANGALAAAAGAGNEPLPAVSSPRVPTAGGGHGGSEPSTPGRASRGLTALLLWFDEVWVSYLDQFVVWKTHDARSLEAELVQMATRMEKSLARKLAALPPAGTVAEGGGGGGGGGSGIRSVSDLQAMKQQVAHDVALLRSRIAKLSGPPGIERLGAAITAARAQVEAEAAASAAAAAVTVAGGAAGGGVHGSTAAVTDAHAASASEASASESESEQSGESHKRLTALSKSPSKLKKPAGGLTRGFFGAKPKPPAAAPAAAASAAAGGGVSDASHRLSQAAVANLSMVNDLLHDPVKRLPTDEVEAGLQAVLSGASSRPSPPVPGTAMASHDELDGLGADAAVALLKSRARALAEAAFWDGVASRVAAALAPGADARVLAAAAAPLAFEVGRDIAGEVSDGALRARLEDEFGGAAGGDTGGDDTTLLARLDAAARFAAAAAVDAQGAGTAGTRGSRGAAAAAVAVSAADAGLVPRSLPGLLVLLERLGALVVEYGAPARADGALSAQQSVRDVLSAALSDYANARSAAASSAAATAELREGGGDSAVDAAARSLADGLVRALRLLHLQTRQLRLDAANARLALLSSQLRGSAGVEYVRDKFAALHRLPPPAPPPAPQRVAAAVPKTWAWLQSAARGLPAIRQYTTSTLGLDLDAAHAAVKTAGRPRLPAPTSVSAQLPAVLRAGLRAPAGSGNSSGGSATAGAAPPASAPPPEVCAVLPAAAASPRGLVRAGLIALVSGGAAAVGPRLPEVWMLDAERLHAAQNAFQQLVVTAAAFLLVNQVCPFVSHTSHTACKSFCLSRQPATHPPSLAQDLS